MNQRTAADNVLLCVIWTGIALLLLTPFIVTPRTVFPFVVGKALYSRALIEIVFATWVALAVIRPAYRPPRSRILVLLGAALGVAVLAACFGASPQRSFWSSYERMQGVVDQAHWFALALVLASTVRTARDWRILLNLNLTAGAVIALLAIEQYSGLHYQQGYLRVSATTGNSIFLAAYLQVNVVIALGFLVRSFIPAAAADQPPPARGRRGRRRNRKDARREAGGSRGLTAVRAGRCFWGATVLLGSWALVLTASRGPMLGLAAALAFLAALYSLLARTRSVRLAASGLVALFGAAAVFASVLVFAPGTSLLDAPVSGPPTAFTPVQPVDRLTDFQKLDTLRNRLLVWKAGVSGFFEHPLIGWGPENYVVVMGRHGTRPLFLAEGRIFDHAHSKPVEELVTKGLAGLLIHLAVWACAFHVVVRAAGSMDSRERIPVSFAGAALAGHFVQSLFSPDAAVGSLQFILLLAFLARLESVGKDPAPAAKRDTRFGARASFLAGMAGRLAERREIRAALVAGAVALAGAGLFANQAVHSAAVSVKRAVTSAGRPADPVGRAVSGFERAIGDFRPLANFPRLVLFDHVAKHWKYLRARRRAEAGRMLALVDAEAAAAVESEPGNWQIRAALARFYQVAGVTDPEYRDTAKRHLDRLAELVPFMTDAPPPTAGFDVRIEEDELLYVRKPCTAADTEGFFFLHVSPADPGDLPEHRRQYGFDLFEFDFDPRGVMLDGECRVAAGLPGYDVAGVTTGQYVSGVEIWREVIPFRD